jgi:hypothetical protein
MPDARATSSVKGHIRMAEILLVALQILKNQEIL